MIADVAAWLSHGVLAGLGAFLYLAAIVTVEALRKDEKREE